MTFFHGRPSAVINRPLRPSLAKEAEEHKGNGTSWRVLEVSEPSAAIRWAAAGYPELLEGEAATEQQKARVAELLKPRPARRP
jgi:hypothetical protein